MGRKGEHAADAYGTVRKRWPFCIGAADFEADGHAGVAAYVKARAFG
jgi:hypothetical protein